MEKIIINGLEIKTERLIEVISTATMQELKKEVRKLDLKVEDDKFYLRCEELVDKGVKNSVNLIIKAINFIREDI